MLEEDIEKLEAVTERSASDEARLADLKSELDKIIKKKEEYVEEHPEQRRLVFRHRKQPNDGDKLEEEPILQKRNVFNKHGLPRHPERSIYYDPIMNPFGVAPPGMPYMERRELDPPHNFVFSTNFRYSALRPDEVDNAEENEEGMSLSSSCIDC